MPVSYKTPSVLSVVKSSKSLVSDGGKKNSLLKEKYPLLFGSAQPVRDDDRRIFVLIISPFFFEKKR